MRKKNFIVRVYTKDVDLISKKSVSALDLSDAIRQVRESGTVKEGEIVTASRVYK